MPITARERQNLENMRRQLTAMRARLVANLNNPNFAQSRRNVQARIAQIDIWLASANLQLGRRAFGTLGRSIDGTFGSLTDDGGFGLVVSPTTTYMFGGEGMPRQFGGYTAAAFTDELRGAGWGVSNIVVEQSLRGGGRQMVSGRISVGSNPSGVGATLKDYFSGYLSDFQAWFFAPADGSTNIWSSTGVPNTTNQAAGNAPVAARDVVIELQGVIGWLGVSGQLNLPSVNTKFISDTLTAQGWKIARVNEVSSYGWGTKTWNIYAKVDGQYSDADIVRNLKMHLQSSMTIASVGIVQASEVQYVNDQSLRNSGGPGNASAFDKFALGLGLSTPVVIGAGALLLVLILRR